MRDRNINMRLFRGQINRDLLVNYLYQYRDGNNPENKYPSVRMTQPSQSLVIDPSFGLSISEGFEKDRLFVPGSKWFQFTTLFSKTITEISKVLYEIFPNISGTDIDIDNRALDMFKTERACSTCGFTMLPCIWFDTTNQGYPAIQIDGLNGSCKIPFEDAIPLNAILNNVDPLTYGLQVLSLMKQLNLS